MGNRPRKHGPSPGTSAQQVSGPDLDARRTQRLRTVELLKTKRVPLQVIAVAEGAALLAEQAIHNVRRHEPPARPSACREGCCWCCHKVVGTSVPEVARITQHLQQSPDALAETRERVLRVDEQRRQLRHDRWAATRLPCPLLADNCCSVYAVRPLTCRGYNSSDALQCERLLESHEVVEVPAYAPQIRLTTLILDGMRSGLVEAGLPGELLELTAALRIALTVPDAVERWLNGESVFAAARMP
jgi:uncharacterized protein